jgi:hypothetical protein
LQFGFWKHNWIIGETPSVLLHAVLLGFNANWLHQDRFLSSPLSHCEYNLPVLFSLLGIIAEIFNHLVFDLATKSNLS